jgi:hypothetical protein
LFFRLRDQLHLLSNIPRLLSHHHSNVSLRTILVILFNIVWQHFFLLSFAFLVEAEVLIAGKSATPGEHWKVGPFKLVEIVAH